MHGGFPLGFMMIGCMIAGEFLNYLFRNGCDAVLDRKHILQLVIWGGISVAALCINANGLNIFLIPFQTVGVKVLQNFVAEWASPDFHQLFQQPFIWLLLALYLLWLGRRQMVLRRRLDELEARRPSLEE